MNQRSQTEAYRLDRDYVFHSWSAQAALDPVVVVSGEGSWFTVEGGDRYLDFCSQLVNLNLGHSHPKIVAAIAEQAATLATVAPNFAVEPRGRAAQMIVERAGGHFDKVFFTNGGAEANEYAVRLARQSTGRLKVLSMYRSYHGSTSGAISLTGDPRRWANEPAVPGAVKFFGPYLYRSAFHATTETEECERALDHLRQVIALEGPDTIAAIIVEPIVGTNGILVPPDGYLRGIRELCDAYGIVLIADEVMSGFARCGEWFAIQHWEVQPDLISFAKGVNSGYVPLGGVVISDTIAAVFDDRVFPGGLTYSGHPLACASAVASMSAMSDEGVIDHVRLLDSDVFQPRLAALAEAHPCVGEVRGVGAFWAIELVRDGATREPLVPFNAKGPDNAPMGQVMAACRARGLWPFLSGNRIHVVPPCNIAVADAERGFDILDEVLGEVDATLT